MFRHVPDFHVPDLYANTTENGRFYTTKEGDRFPSVTTVIGKGTDSSWLEDWRERVGDKEADRISKQANRRGEAVHDLAEKYMKNDPDYKKGHMPNNIASFNYIKPYLDENIGLIAGLEIPLYSTFLKVAGRVDCIAKWNGTWSIVDFKTSRRAKTKEDVFNYMCQEAAYSYMVYERIGLLVPQIVTVMTVDDSEPLVFVDRAKNFLPEFIKIRQKVTAELGI